MILHRNAGFAEVKPALLSLGHRYAAETWFVFEPQFIRFAAEQEYDERETKLGPGVQAFRLEGPELLQLLESERVGFDWTDLAVRLESAPGQPMRVACYVQCVDSATWYIASRDEAVAGLLEREGFAATDLQAMPFKPKPRVVLDGSKLPL
ncbi:hypothetical protein [Tahibacter caeni]|uniref:hypothetical protein n=1 Tax=Tahibacter caeni TaxID=1453545 RepID=UPI002147C81F|nr:hypothetical protein [Tahibacter caeni]